MNDQSSTMITDRCVFEFDELKIDIAILVKSKSIFVWIGLDCGVEDLMLFTPPRQPGKGYSEVQLFGESNSSLSVSIARRISSFFNKFMVLASVNLHPMHDSKYDQSEHARFVSSVSKFVIEKVTAMTKAIDSNN